MLQGYKLFDGDAHTMMSPRMWETLPSEYRVRRPRPTRVHDESDLGRWSNGWLIEGQIIPHAIGPGSQPGNEPARVLEEFGAKSNSEAFPLSSFDLSDPAARLRSMDAMGIDHQMLYPTTLYARMTRDPGFEAALMRSYNRYVGQQCQSSPKRLKWAGLLPLRDARQGLEAIAEMTKIGATAAVVYGTAGDRLLCDESFTSVWDELHRSGLPLCVHMGMSYPPFLEVCDGLLAAHGIGMSLPGMMGFVAIVGYGMLDRYPNLKVGFLSSERSGSCTWCRASITICRSIEARCRSKTNCPKEPSKSRRSPVESLLAAQPTIECCSRKSIYSARIRFSTPPTCPTAKAGTTRRKRSLPAKTSAIPKSARFFTATQSSFSANRNHCCSNAEN